jgi:hypothetical protein
VAGGLSHYLYQGLPTCSTWTSGRELLLGGHQAFSKFTAWHGTRDVPLSLVCPGSSPPGPHCKHTEAPDSAPTAGGWCSISELSEHSTVPTTELSSQGNTGAWGCGLGMILPMQVHPSQGASKVSAKMVRMVESRASQDRGCRAS